MQHYHHLTLNTQHCFLCGKAKLILVIYAITVYDIVHFISCCLSQKTSSKVIIFICMATCCLASHVHHMYVYPAPKCCCGVSFNIPVLYKPAK